MTTSEEISLLGALNDPKRIQVLEQTGLLDSPPEAAFDRLTHLASEALQVPVSLVSLVDRDRQFFKSQFGLAEPLASRRQTPLSHSFCKHLVATSMPLIVSDARLHPLLHDNGAVHDINVIAYLGIPLTTAEGDTIGSFCAIDEKPRDWNEPEIRIMRELAASVMTEVELRLLVRHFQTNCLRMRDLELEREEMTQMLVHDLRNPLTSLILSLGVLETVDLPDASIRSLHSAQKGAKMLARMVNDILDVSKSQAGRLDLQVGEVEPAELIRAACEPILEMANQAGVTISASMDGNVGSFQADGEKLRRTLVNLISNAVQHTPKGGQIDVRIASDKGGRHVIIEITDTGTGIPSEAFDQIFQKFQHAPVATRSTSSTGLGLPFCKMAVEAHGGRITVQSQLGSGTTFRVEIPKKR